jgi:hypothetical protein
MGKGDLHEPNQPLLLESCKNFVDSGIYIFRKNFGEEKQSYFAIMTSPKPIGHGHLDQGSFIIYKNSIPIVMDSGIEGYFDSSTSWHISSYSHACLQFQTKQKSFKQSGDGTINLSAGSYSLERGWVDVPKTSRVLDCQIGREIETISIEIMNPEGTGRHIRQVWYVREPDLYIIRDTIEDFEGEVLFNLPVAAKYSNIIGNRVESRGIYDVDLETVFVSKVKEIQLDKGRSTAFFGSAAENVCMMEYIRATADAKDGFLTIIYPKENGKNMLDVFHNNAHSVTIRAENIEVNLNLESKKINLYPI